MIHIGCAGSIATYGGVNSAGLAMGHAAVLLKDAGGRGSLPVAFLRRQALLHCATVPEAIAFINEYDPWQIGDNVLFLDQNGEAAVVELRPGTQLIHRPVNNAIWCTGCSRQPDVAEAFADGHLKRHRFIERKLQAEKKFSSGLLRDLLSSHEGEAPICRDSTQLSILVYPATGTLKVADGFPCQTGYKTTLQIEK